MVTATFRFYAELNDFLPAARRRREFGVNCPEAATTKQHFTACAVCDRIFWQGSHWRRMQQCVADAQAAGATSDRTGDEA